MSGRLQGDAPKLQTFHEIRPLSHGSSGKVWLVRGHSDGRQYVLKKAEVLGDHYKAGPTSYALQESRILSRLHHHNIVRQIDFFPKKEHWCIVLEHCDGGDLRSIIKDHRERKKSFTDATLFRLLNQVASALAHAHSMGVIHRDIKPANILLRAGDAVVADWGLSHVCAESSETSAYMGTVIYMAPEVRSKRLYSFPADIWSLGMIMYECMCAVDLQYADASKPDLTKLISNTIGFLVRQMLSSDPASRPTAAQIVAATAQYLPSDPSKSRQASFQAVAPPSLFNSAEFSVSRPSLAQAAAATVPSRSPDSRQSSLRASPVTSQSNQSLRPALSPTVEVSRASTLKYLAAEPSPQVSTKSLHVHADDHAHNVSSFSRAAQPISNLSNAPRAYFDPVHTHVPAALHREHASELSPQVSYSPTVAVSPVSSLGVVLERRSDGYYVVSRVQKRGIAYGALFTGEVIAEVGSMNVCGISMQELLPLLHSAVKNQAPILVISANGLTRSAYLGFPSPFSSHHSDEEEIEFDAAHQTADIAELGVTLKELGGEIVIDKVIVQTPKGFQVDDVLRSVNDVSCSGRTLRDVAAALSASDVRNCFASVDRYTDGAWRTFTLSLDAQCLADGFVI
jgi:serine/threonine protein kinase